MLNSIEVKIDAAGRVLPIESSVQLPVGRALLTLLEPLTDETALLAELSLAEDWLKAEEDAAWAHLQPGK